MRVFNGEDGASPLSDSKQILERELRLPRLKAVSNYLFYFREYSYYYFFSLLKIKNITASIKLTPPITKLIFNGRR